MSRFKNRTKSVFVTVGVSSPDKVLEYRPSVDDILGTRRAFYTDSSAAIRVQLDQIRASSEQYDKNGFLIHYLEIIIHKDLYKKFAIEENFMYRVRFITELAYLPNILVTHHIQPVYPIDRNETIRRADGSIEQYNETCLLPGAFRTICTKDDTLKLDCAPAIMLTVNPMVHKLIRPDGTEEVINDDEEYD